MALFIYGTATNTGKGFFTHQDRLDFSLRGYSGHDGSNYVDVWCIGNNERGAYWLAEKNGVEKTKSEAQTLVPASVTLAQINGWNPNVFTITAVGADIRWNIDAAASATTMYIKNGDTLYIKTPSTSDAHTLQAMRNASTDGTLEVIVWNETS